VGRPRGIVGMTALPARECAREDIQQQPKAEALVAALRPAQREDRAARLAIEHTGISGRPSLLVEEPAFRRRHALVEGDAHLPLPNDARADVEDERITGGWGAEAKGVRADAAVDAAGRGDTATETVPVDRTQKRAALSRHDLGILAEAADVSGVSQRPR